MIKCLWCDETFNTKSAKKRHKKRQECTRGDDDTISADAQREVLDIIAGVSIESAKMAAYASGNYEREELDELKEISPSEYDSLTFREDDSDVKNPKNRKSFRAKLNELIAAGESFPTFFASSEL